MSETIDEVLKEAFVLSYEEFRRCMALGEAGNKLKDVIEENKKLCERYPFLIPLSEWTGKPVKDYDYEWTYLDDIPKGWKKAFGIQMCEELRDILIEGDCLEKYSIAQAKEKYGCYDSETEVLTEDGWKYFKDLSFEDRIATLNNLGYLEYQCPTDIIAEKYKGKMYRLENRGISLCVTPNHNLYVAKGSYINGEKNNEKRTYPFELATPDKYFGKDKRFKKGCMWEGEEPNHIFKIKGYEYDTFFKADDPNSGRRHYIDKNREYELVPFLKFLGFYVAEGCVSVGSNNKSASCIAVAYNKTTEEEMVCELLDGIGCDYKDSDTKNNGGVKRFYDRTLGEWLREQCGHGAPNKKVPRFIKKLPPKYIEIFLTYLFIGDGHQTETSNILTTTSKQLSDDVQELLLKCGFCFRCTFRDVGKKYDNRVSNNGIDIKSKHNIYEVNWLKLSEIEIDNSKARHTKSFVEEWINYEGSVYCVSVPNHIIYIRRNGKGIWCGNSLSWYDYGVSEKVADKYYAWLNKYEALSRDTCICCGKPGKMRTDGWISPWCDECYERME